MGKWSWVNSFMPFSACFVSGNVDMTSHLCLSPRPPLCSLVSVHLKLTSLLSLFCVTNVDYTPYSIIFGQTLSISILLWGFLCSKWRNASGKVMTCCQWCDWVVYFMTDVTSLCLSYPPCVGMFPYWLRFSVDFAQC